MFGCGLSAAPNIARYARSSDLCVTFAHGKYVTQNTTSSGKLIILIPFLGKIVWLHRYCFVMDFYYNCMSDDMDLESRDDPMDLERKTVVVKSEMKEDLFADKEYSEYLAASAAAEKDG